MHRVDFELKSEITQTELRDRLARGDLDVNWQGRDSEYSGVYTIARFDNKTVAKIFQHSDLFEIEIAAPKDVSDEWLAGLKTQIVDAFERAQ